MNSNYEGRDTCNIGSFEGSDFTCTHGFFSPFSMSDHEDQLLDTNPSYIKASTGTSNSNSDFADAINLFKTVLDNQFSNLAQKWVSD